LHWRKKGKGPPTPGGGGRRGRRLAYLDHQKKNEESERWENSVSDRGTSEKKRKIPSFRDPGRGRRRGEGLMPVPNATAKERTSLAHCVSQKKKRASRNSPGVSLKRGGRKRGGGGDSLHRGKKTRVASAGGSGGRRDRPSPRLKKKKGDV